MSPERRWSLQLGPSPPWRLWDQEMLLFHAPSGQTHCLNESAASVLMALRERPMTATELATVLAAQAGDRPAPLLAEIEAVLRQFDELGLVGPDLP